MAKMTMEQLQRKIERWKKEAPSHLQKYLEKGAKLVTREVQAAHLSGPRMSRGVGHPTRATLAAVTGTLRRSVTEDVKVSKDSVVARIGTDVFYGRIHEEGLGKMPKRPFLRPSVMEKKPRVLELVLEGMMEAYDRGK